MASLRETMLHLFLCIGHNISGAETTLPFLSGVFSSQCPAPSDYWAKYIFFCKVFLCLEFLKILVSFSILKKRLMERAWNKLCGVLGCGLWAQQPSKLLWEKNVFLNLSKSRIEFNFILIKILILFFVKNISSSSNGRTINSTWVQFGACSFVKEEEKNKLWVCLLFGHHPQTWVICKTFVVSSQAIRTGDIDYRKYLEITTFWTTETNIEIYYQIFANLKQ